MIRFFSQTPVEIYINIYDTVLLDSPNHCVPRPLVNGNSLRVFDIFLGVSFGPPCFPIIKRSLEVDVLLGLGARSVTKTKAADAASPD